MATYSRRTVLGSAGLALTGSLAGCSDEDDPEPGLHAVDVLVLHRSGDDWYEFPEEVGVRVTVENTANEFREGTLVLTVRPVNGDDSWVQERNISMGRARSRTYEFAVDVGASEAREFEADAAFE